MSSTSAIASLETDTNTQDNIDLEEVVAELTSMGIDDIEENESQYTPMLSVDYLQISISRLYQQNNACHK
jgi:hypothetical protein